jgi:hypothetical protein
MSRKYFEFGDSPRPKSPPAARGSVWTCQIPERSGLPFTLGTGPVMLILPSAVRGAPAIGWFSHWARSDTLAAPHARTATTASREIGRMSLIRFASLHEGWKTRSMSNDLLIFVTSRLRERTVLVLLFTASR